MAQRAPRPEGRLQVLIDGYQQSGEFRTLRERTQADYIKQIKIIEAGIRRLPDQGAGGARDARRVHGLARQAGAQIGAAGRLCVDRAGADPRRGRRIAERSPSIRARRGGRLYNGTRVDFVWTMDDEAAFLSDGAGASALAAIARACGPASGRVICCD